MLGASMLVLGTNTLTKENVACIKVEPKNISKFMDGDRHILALLKSNPHNHLPHIRASLQCTTGNRNAYVIMDQVHSDLHNYIRDNKQLDEPTARNFFKQILSAVSHLHSHRIALRDMKLGKIMFKNSSLTDLVIADLSGATSFLPNVSTIREPKGSPAYVAPEILKSIPYDPFVSDIWSLGVMLYIMLTGSYPFQDQRWVHF